MVKKMIEAQERQCGSALTERAEPAVGLCPAAGFCVLPVKDACFLNHKNVGRVLTMDGISSRIHLSP
jgi:hypothetical protein